MTTADHEVKFEIIFQNVFLHVFYEYA